MQYIVHLVILSPMEITRTSVLSNITRTLDLNVTVDQLHAHSMGLYAQEAFPQLTPDEREFIISGITSEEWNAHFGTDDDEGDENFNFDDMPEPVPVEDRQIDSAWECRNEAHDLGGNW